MHGSTLPLVPPRDRLSGTLWVMRAREAVALKLGVDLRRAVVYGRNVMRTQAFFVNQQPCIARVGDPMAPWHAEGAQALGTKEKRSG